MKLISVFLVLCLSAGCAFRAPDESAMNDERIMYVEHVPPVDEAQLPISFYIPTEDGEASSGSQLEERESFPIEDYAYAVSWKGAYSRTYQYEVEDFDYLVMWPGETRFRSLMPWNDLTNDAFLNVQRLTGAEIQLPNEWISEEGKFVFEIAVAGRGIQGSLRNSSLPTAMVEVDLNEASFANNKDMVVVEIEALELEIEIEVRREHRQPSSSGSALVRVPESHSLLSSAESPFILPYTVGTQSRESVVQLREDFGRLLVTRTLDGVQDLDFFGCHDGRVENLGRRTGFSRIAFETDEIFVPNSVWPIAGAKRGEANFIVGGTLVDRLDDRGREEAWMVVAVFDDQGCLVESFGDRGVAKFNSPILANYYRDVLEVVEPTYDENGNWDGVFVAGTSQYNVFASRTGLIVNLLDTTGAVKKRIKPHMGDGIRNRVEYVSFEGLERDGDDWIVRGTGRRFSGKHVEVLGEVKPGYDRVLIEARFSRRGIVYGGTDFPRGVRTTVIGNWYDD